MKPNWPVKTVRINGCRHSHECCRTAAESGDVIEVEMEGYSALGNPYLFLGTGESLQFAIDDAAEHGAEYFEGLASGGSLGDWWMKGAAPPLESDYWQDMAREVRNG